MRAFPPSHQRRQFRIGAAFAALLAAALGSGAWAQTLPTGGAVSQGTASIGTPSGGTLTITQSSSRAVVNWSSFSVGSGGSVVFNQPGASSAILNRVASGASASQIDGQIQSNGQVFLINPNGIAISSTGVVNTTGGFVASTLDVSDTDFMNGNLNFAAAVGGSGSVSNAGSISSNSFAVLLGTSVSNSGLISVPLGKIGLGAATSATLDLNGGGFLQVVLPADASDASGQPLVSNSGQIQADGGQIVLAASTAAGAVQQAVNVSGSLRAESVSGVNGDITLSAGPSGSITLGSSAILDAKGSSSDATQNGGVISISGGGAVSVSGILGATGQSGGRIDVTGDTVALTGAALDASGPTAGGLIRIGGAYKYGAANDGSADYADYQYFVTRWGSLPSLAVARTVSIDSASSLYANGTTPPAGGCCGPSGGGGTGGTIIITSSQDTAVNTALWRAGGYDGAAAVSSEGVISALTFPTHLTSNAGSPYFYGDDLAEHLFFGAQDILIAPSGTAPTGTSLLSTAGLEAVIGNARSASIEASDALTVTGGFDPADGGALAAYGLHASDFYFGDGTLQTLSFSAGRVLTVSGALDSTSADLFFYGNDTDANGGDTAGRGVGPGLIDLRNATLDYTPIVSYQGFGTPGTENGNHRNITVSLLAGADDAAGGLLYPGLINGDPNTSYPTYEQGSGFNDLTLTAAGQGAIEFTGNVNTNITIPPPYPPAETITLTGNLIFAANTTIAGYDLVWTDQNTATITGDSQGQAHFSAGYAINNMIDHSLTADTIAEGTVTQDTSQVLPANGIAVQGGALIDTSVTDALTITLNTERAVIDWQSFSIGSAASVTFVEPNASAAVLNRVPAGGGASVIDGALHGNGQVFLINPNGISISSTGVINTTGGFVGSTLDVSDTNFMNSQLSFSGTGAAVSNLGSITTGTGGFVALLGETLDNTGPISALGGDVALGAGSAFSLTPGGGSLLSLTTGSADATASDALLSQTGAITAAGGQVQILAASTNASLDQTVQVGGTITAASGSVVVQAADAATSVYGDISVDQAQSGGAYASGGAGGSISVVGDALTETGTLTAKGDSGGRIDLTASDLTLTGATLDASGTTKGGLVRVGGAYHYGASENETSTPESLAFAGRFSATPALATAGTVQIDAASSLTATGATGGTVIIGSSQNTAFAGVANVGSSGGALAITSLGTISQMVLPTSGGSNGATLLIGSESLNLQAGANSGGVTWLDPAALATELPLFANVYVEAGDTVTLPQGLSLNLAGSSLASVTFRAGRGVSATGTLQAGGAALALIANDPLADGAGTSERQAGASYLDVSAATVVSYGTQSGALSFQLLAGNDGGASGTVSLPVLNGAAHSGTSVASFGNLTISAASGADILFHGDVATDNGQDGGTAGTLTLTGSLAFADDTVISSNSLNWTNGTSSSVSGYAGGQPSFTVTAALVNDGTVVDRGVLQDGVAARLDFGGLGSSQNVSAEYGVAPADLAGQVMRLTSGSLGSGVTLANLLPAGSITVTAPGETGTDGRLQAGAQTLHVTALSGLPQGSDPVGYFFNLVLPTLNQVTVTQRPLTYSVANVESTYGTQAPVSPVLNGVLADDQVAGVIQATQGSVSLALAARLNAGSYTTSLSGLSGSDAANYVIQGSGDQTGTLTVDQKPLSFTGPTLTSTYGATATLSGGVLTGVLTGDSVSAPLALRQSGNFTQPSATLAAGAYAVATTGITGADVANYVLSSNTDGSLTVGQKALTVTLTGASYVYGSPTAVLSITGLVNGDTLTPTTSLDGSSTSLAAANGGGFELAVTIGAGTHDLNFGGLTGAALANYAVSAPVTDVQVPIAQKPLTWSVTSLTTTYGNLAAPVGQVTGVINNDSVSPVIAASQSGSAVTLAARTTAGSYDLVVGGLSGGGAANYTLSVSGDSPGVLTIGPLSIGYSIANATSTYGTTAVVGGSLSGVLQGDGVALAVAASQGASPVTLASRTAAGSYQLSGSLTGADAIDYRLSGVSNATLTIDPLAVTYSIGNGSSTYGTLFTPSLTLTGVLTGDDVSGGVTAHQNSQAVTLAAGTNAGTYALDFSGLAGGSAANYVVAGTGNVSGSLTISPRILGLTAPASLQYGASAGLALGQGFSLTNLFGTDALTGTLGLTTTLGATVTYGPHTSVGTYDVVLTNLAATSGLVSNYVLSPATVTLAITPKPLSFTGPTLASTYGTAATVSGGVLTGVVSGDDVSAALELLQGSTVVQPTVTLGAGSYAVAATGLTGTTAGDYTLGSETNGALTVAQHPLTITLTGASYVYGSPTTLVTISGLVNGDVLAAQTNLDGSPAALVGMAGGGFGLNARTNAGTHDFAYVGLSGANLADYLVSVPTTDVSVSISAKPLTWTVPSLSSTYGVLAAPSPQLSTLVSGDSVSPVLSVTSSGAPVTLASRTAAGAYGLGVSGLTGPNAGNYVLASTGDAPGTLTINPAPVTYSFSASSYTYGDAAVISDLLSGVLQGDVVTLTSQVVLSGNTVIPGAQTPAGTYQLSGVLAGASAGDYYISSGTGASLQILRRPVTYIVTGGSSTYGNLFSTTYSLANVVNGDSVGGAIGATLQGGSGSSALSAGLNAGTYSLQIQTLNGAGASNYSIASSGDQAGVLTVNPRPVGLSGTVGLTYGASAPLSLADGFTITNVYGGDVLSGQPVLTGASSYGAYTSVGGYSVTLSGLTATSGLASNYVIDPSALATLNITPKPLTLGNLSTVYGSSSPLSANLVGVLPNDVVSDGVSVSSQGTTITYGPYTSVGAYGLAPQGALAGAQALDYSLSPSLQAALTITPKPITLTTTPIQGVYGDADLQASSQTFSLYPLANGLQNFVYQGGQFSGVLVGDAVTGVFLTQAVAASSGYLGARSYQADLTSLTGSQAADYSITIDHSTTTTLNVAPRPVTLAGGAQTATYGATGALPTVALGNVLTADASSISGSETLYTQGGALVTYGARTGVGAYNLTLVGLTGTPSVLVDYTISGTPSVTLTIDPLLLTVAPSFLQQTYGSTSTANAITGVLSGDSVTGLVDVTGSGGAQVNLGGRPNAGTYTLQMTGLSGASAADYTINTSALYNLTVAPLALGLSSSFLNQTYGTTSYANPLAGVLSGDSVTGSVNVSDSLGGSVNLAARPGAGTYTAALTGLGGLSAGNYVVSSAASAGENLTVGRASLTISSGAANYVYGSPQPVFSIQGLFSGDQVAPQVTLNGTSTTVSGGSNPNAYLLAANTPVMTAGQVNVTGLSGAFAQDYQLTGSTQVPVTITPKTLQLTALSPSYVYGSPTAVLSVGGVLPGDQVVIDAAGSRQGSSGTVSAALASSDEVNFLLPANQSAGVFSLSTSGLAGANGADYQLATSVSFGATITPRPLTYAIGAYSWVYGSPSPVAVQLNGVLQGDTVTPVALTAPGVLAGVQTDAGSYGLTAGLTGSAASNYSVSATGDTQGSLTVSQRPVTFAAAYSTIYGSNVVPTSQFSSASGATGLINSDSLTATTSSSTVNLTQADVGTYAYDGLSFGGAKLNDYAITVAGPQNVTITPRTLTLTRVSDGGSQPYLYATILNGSLNNYFTLLGYGNGAISFSRNWFGDRALVTASGLVNGDAVGVAVQVHDQTTQAIYDPSTEFTQNASGLVLSQYAYACNCAYSVTGLTGAKAADYVLSGGPVSGSFQITPLPVQLTAANTTTTYGADPTLLTTFVGMDGYEHAQQLIVRDETGQPAPAAQLSNIAPIVQVTQTGGAISLASGRFTQGAWGAPFNQPSFFGYESTYTLNGGSAPLLDAGTYNYTVTGLGGPAGRNYYLAGGPVSGTITVNPAPYTFSLKSNVYYGDQQEVSLLPAGDAYACCKAIPDTRPLLAVTSNTFGANVQVSVSLLDASNTAYAYTPTLNAGTYGVAASLSGAQASDFVLTNTPTSFVVQPAIINYQINSGSGLYQAGIGFEGTPPSISIVSGLYGSDTATVLLGVFPGNNGADTSDPVLDLSTAAGGTYHFQAAGLIASSNYVLAPANNAGNSVNGSGQGLLTIFATPPLLFDPITLTVTSTSTSTGAPSSVNATPTTGSTANASPDAAPASSSSGSLSALLNDIPRVSVGVDAGAQTSGSGSVAGVDVTGQAAADAQAGASANPVTGAKAGVSATASASATTTYGPGFTTVGADSSAQAAAAVKLLSMSPGISASTSASVGVYVQSGAQGGLGGAGDGSASVIVGAGGDAAASLQISPTGKVQVQAMAVGGASIGVTGQLTGSQGTVEAGVTAYGNAVGLVFSPDVGYSDGQIDISLSIGGALGGGGVANINLAVSPTAILNVSGDVGQYFAGLANNNGLADGASRGVDYHQVAVNVVAQAKQININPFSNPSGYATAINNLIEFSSAYSETAVSEYAPALGAQVVAAVDYSRQQATIKTLAQQGQALETKALTNPQSMTYADAKALDAISQEQQLAWTALQSDVKTLGGVATLGANGSIQIGGGS